MLLHACHVHGALRHVCAWCSTARVCTCAWCSAVRVCMVLYGTCVHGALWYMCAWCSTVRVCMVLYGTCVHGALRHVCAFVSFFLRVPFFPWVLSSGWCRSICIHYHLTHVVLPLAGVAWQCTKP